jgi:hypothetical protein
MLTRTQADGRDSDSVISAAAFQISREVYVPRFENGSVHYMIMNVVATSDFDSGWTVKDMLQPFSNSSGADIKAINNDENLKGAWGTTMD